MRANSKSLNLWFPLKHSGREAFILAKNNVVLSALHDEMCAAIVFNLVINNLWQHLVTGNECSIVESQ